MKIDPRIPEPVQPCIKDYLQLTAQCLVGVINASYAGGFIALAEFHEHFNDNDFVILFSLKATPIDFGQLHSVH
jgi:hypothetical protein